jgi:hypothetical protein
MNTERDQNKNEKQQGEQSATDQQVRRSGAFNESNRGDEKSTRNVEEEIELEQKRKQALTERD